MSAKRRSYPQFEGSILDFRDTTFVSEPREKKLWIFLPVSQRITRESMFEPARVIEEREEESLENGLKCKRLRFLTSSLARGDADDAFVVAVKYLREVTPYFRKASIIQEVGWELQRGFLSATPPPPKSPPRADTRYLPLQLCRLTRAHPTSDPDLVKLPNSIANKSPKMISSFNIRCCIRNKVTEGKLLREFLSNNLNAATLQQHYSNNLKIADAKIIPIQHRPLLLYCCTATLQQYCSRYFTLLIMTFAEERHMKMSLYVTQARGLRRKENKSTAGRVENKQSGLNSPSFRKLAGAFLDHELQKPALSARLRNCSGQPFEILLSFPLLSEEKPAEEDEAALLARGNRKPCESTSCGSTVCPPEDSYEGIVSGTTSRDNREQYLKNAHEMHFRFDQPNARKAIDYTVRRARDYATSSHTIGHLGPSTGTSATACKSYLNWRWQVYPPWGPCGEGIDTSDCFLFQSSVLKKQEGKQGGGISGCPNYLPSSFKDRFLGSFEDDFSSAKIADKSKAASKDESATRKPDGIVKNGLLTWDRIRIQTSSSQFRARHQYGRSMILKFGKTDICQVRLSKKVLSDDIHGGLKVWKRSIVSQNSGPVGKYFRQELHQYGRSMILKFEKTDICQKVTEVRWRGGTVDLEWLIKSLCMTSLCESGKKEGKAREKSMCPSVAGIRMPNTDSGSGFRCPEKAGRNVAPLSRAASRIRNLVNSPETVNSGTFDSPVVYSAVRLPTSPTQITDATGQRYFVQMARWRIVHTNEDPPDRINRAPQHHEYRLALGARPSARKLQVEAFNIFCVTEEKVPALHQVRRNPMISRYTGHGSENLSYCYKGKLETRISSRIPKVLGDTSGSQSIEWMEPRIQAPYPRNKARRQCIAPLIHFRVFATTIGTVRSDARIYRTLRATFWRFFVHDARTMGFDSSANSYKNPGSSISPQTYWLNLSEF
ncbi:hypothetical protein EAG_11591 [Camponotus floridanus]|uniref:Uncharacterized protein n=1 Tax=Camponotus floridanus TaxID=104421 RepID=E2A4A8_CAMFO|nr:hypothetical protein EAG_11591 [Camponotus floridanus]